MHIFEIKNLILQFFAGRIPVAVVVGPTSGHTCTILTDGRMICWGENNLGQLGIGNSTNVGTSPEQLGDKLQSVNLGAGSNRFLYVIIHSISILFEEFPFFTI